MLFFFIRKTIVLDSNGSLLRDNKEEWAFGEQKGLHLFTYGVGLTPNYIVKFNIYLACQTYLIQSELFVSDTTGL